MSRAPLGWTVTGIGVAVLLVLYERLGEPTPVVSWLLGLVGGALILYGLWLVFRKPVPDVEVYAALAAAGQWQSDWTGFQVELTVTVNWHSAVQLQFTLVLGDGTPLDSETYHRQYIEGRVPPGFLDNPKLCDPGRTGPFKIAFVVPKDFIAPNSPPLAGLELRYRSVLSDLGVAGLSPVHTKG